VGVFISRVGNAACVAVTGAGPHVFRLPGMEDALAKSFAPAAIENIKIETQHLNDDIHASRAYRAHLVTVLAKRAVTAAS